MQEYVLLKKLNIESIDQWKRLTYLRSPDLNQTNSESIDRSLFWTLLPLGPVSVTEQNFLLPVLRSICYTQWGNFAII